MKPTIIYSQILSTLDWFVFFIILLMTFAAVFYGHLLQKKKSEKQTLLEILLMGRQLTLPMFVATLVATWYGGILGVTQIAFEKGIYNIVTQGIFWYIAYIIFALFMVNKIRASKAVTLPEMVGKLFGPKSGKLSAVLNFFNILPISYAISIGLFLDVLFGGGLLINMSAGILFAVFYTMFGGFRSVVFSDLVQFGVMCSSVALVLIFSVFNYGGLSFLLAKLPTSHFSITGDENYSIMLVWGFIALSTLVDPSFYQRCFAAKSDRIARNGILISTIIWFCFDICTTFGGMYARAIIPEASSKQAYLVYALQLLPNGLRGFFLAGVLATILSTLDAFMFIAGNTVSYDLMPEKFRNKIWIHYVAVFFVGLFCILLGLFFEGNIKLTWKIMGSYFTASLLIPVVLAFIFPGKISDNHFLTASLSSVISITLCRYFSIFIAVDPLYIGMAVSLLILLPVLLFKQFTQLKNFNGIF